MLYVLILVSWSNAIAVVPGLYNDEECKAAVAAVAAAPTSYNNKAFCVPAGNRQTNGYTQR